MIRGKRVFYAFMVVSLLLSTSACNLVPSAFDVDLDVETTSELGEDTLSRIDAVNETLATGLEIGPETRGLIRELNETIQGGIKTGFDEETLARVDDMLRVIEDGLKIGLDQDTLDEIDQVIDTLDQQPGQWEAAASDVIRTLEGSAGTLAGRMSDEIDGVLQDARLNMQKMTAAAGAEFRCNVDFLGSKAGSTVEEFIGRSIIGKLKSIITGQGPQEAPVPTPWVCQIIPDQIGLAPLSGRLIALEGVITVTGYNYVEANAPSALILDETGAPITAIQLYPFRTSPYQIQINLQDLDFTAVPARARLVLQWPNVAETSGIAILRPGYEAPVAKFQANPPSGGAPLTVQFTDLSTGSPTQWQWSFGDGGTSNEQNPVHTYVEGQSYQVQLTASNAMGSSIVSDILVVSDQLAADFRFSPRQGVAPLVVQFEDTSTGSPSAWLWDFGDGGTSTEQNPEHVYFDPLPEGYTVTLQITGPQGTANKTSPDRVIVKEKLDADFQYGEPKGLAPLTIAFTDTSKGTGITQWLWDFGDGQTSAEPNPTHTYTEQGLYDVSLTITNMDGETNTEAKRGLVNAIQFRLLQPMIPLQLSTLHAYFSSYHVGPTTGMKDTGISSDKYVCGIVGMVGTDGDINEGGAGDIFKMLMFKQYSQEHGKNTWWISADLRTHRHHEDWDIKTLCMEKASQGSIYLYRDDFRGIVGGEPYTTNIRTEDYYFCGIVGQEALYGDINEVGVRPVIWQAYMDGTGDKWKIMVDFASHGTDETWHANVLCLKRGAHLVSEKPPFVTQTFYFSAATTDAYSTGIVEADYLCGITGVSAERGDIQEDGTQHTMLVTYMPVEGGIWQIFAHFATHNKQEDWRVDVLCINRAFAKAEPPPE